MRLAKQSQNGIFFDLLLVTRLYLITIVLSGSNILGLLRVVALVFHADEVTLPIEIAVIIVKHLSIEYCGLLAVSSV